MCKVRRKGGAITTLDWLVGVESAIALNSARVPVMTGTCRYRQFSFRHEPHAIKPRILKTAVAASDCHHLQSDTGKRTSCRRKIPDGTGSRDPHVIRRWRRCSKHQRKGLFDRKVVHSQYRLPGWWPKGLSSGGFVVQDCHKTGQVFLLPLQSEFSRRYNRGSEVGRACSEKVVSGLFYHRIWGSYPGCQRFDRLIKLTPVSRRR